jgi:hypothetical protein
MSHQTMCLYWGNYHQMRRYTLIFFILSLWSCNTLESRPFSFPGKVTDSSQLGNLPGVWSASSTTYSMLKNKRYKQDTLLLVLKPDSTFTGINFPDCIDNLSGDPVKGLLSNGSGLWAVYQSGKYWKLRLDFEKNQTFSDKTFLDFDISLDGTSTRLSEYLGDPDNVDILEYERNK